MSDAQNVHETIPLVQSSGSLNNCDQQNMTSSGSKAPMAGQMVSMSSNSSSGGSITIQAVLPGSSSFVVGTKANQSIISDTPVTDPGGSNTKQVCCIQLTCFFFLIRICACGIFFSI